MSQRRPDPLILVASFAIAASFGVWAWTASASGGGPRRFWTVVPDKLFRGGYAARNGTVTEPALRELVSSHHIKTLVSLTDDSQACARVDAERKVVADLKLNFVNIPMPGSGAADFDSLDRAADALADEHNQPVYFRCAAGKQRSNAALAAWRMKHCGWTADKAIAELDGYELDHAEDARLIDNLRKYYSERIMPRRTASQQAH